MRRALMQFLEPENYFTVREALLQAGRGDLIGGGRDCLTCPSRREGSDRSAADTGERGGSGRPLPCRREPGQGREARRAWGGPGEAEGREAGAEVGAAGARERAQARERGPCSTTRTRHLGNVDRVKGQEEMAGLPETVSGNAGLDRPRAPTAEGPRRIDMESDSAQTDQRSPARFLPCLRSRAESVSQTRTVKSPEALARRVPSGLNARAFT